MAWCLYPKPRCTVASRSHKKYPYLRKGVVIDRPGQVWSADITYVPMPSGFMYLVATIDRFRRLVVSWRLSNTLDGSFCQAMLEESLTRGGPAIFNTDQGVPFTATVWTSRLEQAGIQVSMDGVGRCHDNIFVERLWRSVKYERAKTGARHTRCRAGYNCGGRVPVGLARVGPLLPGVPRPHRRSRTMSDRPTTTPPRA